MIPTRLVRLLDTRLNTPHRLWTTLEGENPGGSIKDRMVEPELSLLRDVTEISEISAGSTALSLSYYAKKIGIKCHFFIPDDANTEIKKKLLNDGCLLTESDKKTAYASYESYCRSGTTWPFHQMKRKNLRLHYRDWAEKHILPHINNVQFVMGSVGTGHSLLGVSAAFKPRVRCIAIEPTPEQEIHGIRNLTSQNFGAEDPCELTLIDERLQACLNCEFEDRILLTDLGPILIGDSFRLTLVGALSYLKKTQQIGDVFLIGSNSKRC